jgi:hypothetical protein
VSGNSFSTIGGDYQQVIKNNAYKNVKKQDFTIGGVPITGLVSAASVSALPIALNLATPVAAMAMAGAMAGLADAPDVQGDSGTTAQYKAVDVKYEVYYGNTYKWIKGAKYEREGVDPANDIPTTKQIYVSDTGSKAQLGTYLATFALEKSTREKTAATGATNKVAFILNGAANTGTMSAGTITMTGDTANGLPGQLTFNAQNRTATITGNCTETITTKKAIVVATNNGLSVESSQASLTVKGSGISITSSKVTIGPKVDLGMPVPAIVGQQPDQTDDAGTLNKMLADLQQKAGDAYVLADMAWDKVF